MSVLLSWLVCFIEPTEDVTPTIGFSSSKLVIRRHHVNFYDLGGNSRTRDIWGNYFSEVSSVKTLTNIVHNDP